MSGYDLLQLLAIAKARSGGGAYSVPGFRGIVDPRERVVLGGGSPHGGYRSAPKPQMQPQADNLQGDIYGGSGSLSLRPATPDLPAGTYGAVEPQPEGIDFTNPQHREQWANGIRQSF